MPIRRGRASRSVSLRRGPARCFCHPGRGLRSSGRGSASEVGGHMLKWKLLAVLGFAFGIAGIEWGRAQQKSLPGFYELRVYTAEPGKRDALAARFANRTAGTYARHGITNVGYWIPLESDPELGISGENTFIYMRGYPSKEERDKRLKAAHDDPEFGEVVTKQEQNPQTRLIVKAHNIDMVPSGSYMAIAIAK